jgi:gamma-glutamylaminecyclotransferase
MALIFVYGTLKKGKSLNFYLKNATFLEEGVTLLPYPLIVKPGKWYPYLLNLPGKGYRVRGEIYRLDFQILKKLDRLEEVPHYYRRAKIRVRGALSHRTYHLWTYFHLSKSYRKRWLLSQF